MSTATHELPATIPHAIERASRCYPHAVAVEFAGRRVTFSELEHACNRVTAAFLAYDLRKGDRVAVWAPNSAEWIVAAVGAQAARWRKMLPGAILLTALVVLGGLFPFLF